MLLQRNLGSKGKPYVYQSQRMDMTARVLGWVLEQLQHNSSVVLASVVATKGSVPGKSGARLAMKKNNSWIGTVGGAGLEKKILNRCEELLTQTAATSEVLTFGLNKGAKGYEVQPLDSLCGGQVTIALELMMPMPHILLMGGGHCSEAISKLLPLTGWNYSVQDTREAFAHSELYPNAVELHAMDVIDFFEHETAESLSRFSDILLLGHDYQEDLNRLKMILHRAQSSKLSLDGDEFPRIGAIGSRSKWQTFASACIEDGIEQAYLSDVRCPIGLNVGADSPEEIAIAVLAEILSLHKGVDVHSPTWREK
jgi:xanthine dehydrogenase accessory factor